MNLYLIRHTNVSFFKHLCYGATNVNVADTFLNEAKLVNDNIKDLVFDEVWSSPLQRCSKLASVLFPNQKVNFDDRLKELNFGDWEGVAWAKIYEDPYGKKWMDDYVNLPCPKGESFQDQITRVAEFFEEKKDSFQSKNIAIVCHGGTIRSFYCYLKGIKPHEAFEKAFDYGSVNCLKL